MGDPVMCCLLGICCPPAEQRAAWIDLFMTRFGFNRKQSQAMTEIVLTLEADKLKAFAEALAPTA
jgi:hypothetical protein